MRSRSKMLAVSQIFLASSLAWVTAQAYFHGVYPPVLLRCHTSPTGDARHGPTRHGATRLSNKPTSHAEADRGDISPLRDSFTRRDFMKGASFALVTALTGLVAERASAETGAETSTDEAHRSIPVSPSRVGVRTTGTSYEANGRRLGDLTPLVAAEETASESAISGLVAGAAVSTAKQLLLHPVDTVKTRLQVKRESGGSDPEELFKGLYDGVLPPLLVGAPSGALFFAVKDACSTAIANSVGPGYADLTTVIAVGLAQFPYWGLRTPAELLKTRSQAGVSAGVDGGAVSAARSVVAEEGVRGLYTGYTSNIAYAFPADAIKFLVYGALKRSAREAKGGAKLGTIEAAVLGSAASMVAQAVTTPLDVVRTRVMTASANEQPYDGGVAGALVSIAREEGSAKLWAGTLPRVARSVLSGAIQFGSYEFVKGLFGVEPRKL